jgi:hypothetical protein
MLARTALAHVIDAERDQPTSEEELTQELATRSHAALTLWSRAGDRETRRIIACASRRERPLRIDGQPVSFTFLEANGRWAAVRRHGDLTITVTARDVEPETVSLRPLDPATIRLTDPTRE